MAQKKITDLQLRSSVTDDLNFPSDDTIQSYRVTGQQIYDYMRTRFFAPMSEITNLTLTTSVGSSALTIALKTKAAATPSSTDYIRVGFRNATLTTGDFAIRTITAATSLVVSSGSTLGQTSAQPSRIWVYLLDAGSSPEIAVSGKRFREDELVSTTAEGGAGAADSRTVMYSTTARTNVACRLIGYIDNTQTTAGTWASAGTQIQLMPAEVRKPMKITDITSGSSTFYPSAGCIALRIRMVGAGGGSGGVGSTTSAGDGSTGGTTTFGSFTAVGGSGGAKNNSTTGGSGGNAGTGGSGSASVRRNGGAGGAGHGVNASYSIGVGGVGGGTLMGPPTLSKASGTSQAGATNSGAGGGGQYTSSTTIGGSGGGGGGEYVEVLILDPASSYAYTVGAGGLAGTAGTGGVAGGAGGDGAIIVEEYF